MARFSVCFVAILVSSVALCQVSFAEIPGGRRDLSRYDCPTVADPSGQVRVAFFDADSTIRISRVQGVSASYKEDVLILPFVAEKLRELNREGYLVAVVSNQGGISTGKVTREVAEGALLFTIRQIFRLGALVEYFDFAEKYDDKDIENGFRKPAVGMGKALEGELKRVCGDNFSIDKNKSFMVGDSADKEADFSSADRIFAENFGIDFFEPKDFFGWVKFGVNDINHDEDKPAEKLEYFLDILEKLVLRLKENGKDERLLHRLETEIADIKRVNALASVFKFVHYNIKELTTAKLEDPSNEQVKAAMGVLSALSPDLLSINELQYDMPYIPTLDQPKTTGENMRRILEKILPDPVEIWRWGWTFAEANTGRNARKRDGENYFSDPSEKGARECGDQINFGIFPGQYSTGFATPYLTISRFVYSDLEWKEWNPDVDLSKFSTYDGKPFPEDADLFDKNFNHTVIDFHGTPINIITFHTVPAFGFGSKKTPNFVRNHDQLEFLEWYLTGKCDPASKSVIRRCERSAQYDGHPVLVKPIEKGKPFVAVGDLNVDRTSDNPGAEVINRLFANKMIQSWMPRNWDPAFRQDKILPGSYITYLSDGMDLSETSWQSQLDYFLVSKHFNILSGEVYVPVSDFREDTCFSFKKDALKRVAELEDEFLDQTPHRVVDIIEQWGKMIVGNSKMYCVFSVTREFADFRKGSDHLPIYVNLELRN